MSSHEQVDARSGTVDTTYEPDPRRWRVLAVSLVIGFMSLLDVTIVNVAVPSIRAGLGTSAATIQWVVSGYALAFGMTLVAGGRLGDAHGRRRMMMVGLVGFVASSLAVGLAPSAADRGRTPRRPDPGRPPPAASSPPASHLRRSPRLPSWRSMSVWTP